MASGDEIRERLRRAAVERRKARGKLAKADRELARWLKATKASTEVTVVEAEKITGFERAYLYKLMKKAG